MLQAKVISPSDLSARERAYWLALQNAVPEFRSPLLGPDFATIVGQVRPDAAVLVFTRNGAPVGFLPHHRRPSGTGRPIGSPFSDLHGMVSEGALGLDDNTLLGHAGLKSFHFSGLVDPFAIFARSTTTHQESYFVSGKDAFERIRDARGASYKKTMHRERKLNAEVGKVDVRCADIRPSALQSAFGWKRDQLRRTGLHDFLRPEWTRSLMSKIFESPFGILVTLNIDDRPIAGRFGFACRGVFHTWITSYDPALSVYSVGNLLLWKTLEALPGMGLHTWDLGPGHSQGKAPYATGVLHLGEGVAPTPRHTTLAFPSAIRKRLDQIARVELDDLGRVYGLLSAVVSRANRSSRRAAQGRACTGRPCRSAGGR